MPKGRMLNKKISKDIEVAQLSCKSALLYSWCIPHLDVEGRIEASPEIIKGVVVPYRKDFTLSVIKQCIEEISQIEGLIAYYGNTHKYMQFLGFTKNQTLNKDREAPSEIPAPTQEELQSKSGLNLSKVKLNIREGANALLSDDDFLKILKTNPAYKGIDIDRELGKMDTWLLANPGRQKTRRFIVRWLNKADKIMGVVNKPEPQPNPTCTTCNGTGKISEGDRQGRQCYCVR
jgi:hypothetical protein